MKFTFTKLGFISLCCMGSFILGAFFTKHTTTLPITAPSVEKASTLLGLQFTEAETDSMLSGLEELRTSYDTLRKITLSNDIAPALYFNPLPTGFSIEKTKKPFQVGSTGKVTRPVTTEDLAFYTVHQLAELLRTRQITSVELTQFFLERLKTYGPRLECVITLTEDLAMKQAIQADAEIKAGKYKGFLHGIPYGAKDLLATRNYKTTWGSVPYKDQVINTDATVIKKLQAAGAVLVAKLTLGELAMGDVWFGGKTRNPWNTQLGSSGSSAGSAAAVAAGLVPFAIGTETLGSIVSPATVCGVTGLRPTYGRVSRTGAMALSWSMDKIGPMCRTVEDCAIVFNAIHGPDGLDKTVVDAPFNYNGNKPIKGLRIGYLSKEFDQVNAQNKPFTDAALQKIKEMGINLIPVDLPDLPANNLLFIISAEAAAAFDELTRTNKDDLMVKQLKNSWPNEFRTARFIPAVEYIQANRIRTLLIEQMAAKMKEIDVLVAPTYGGLRVTNLTGHPCVVLPNGFTPQQTPTSLVFIGNLYDEATLLTVAKAYQDATGFHKKHPVLAQ
ncbi:amidase [Rhodocytophaga aerolata]|uniref:Amidase n=1 Tax=Rhodocytophaga aerolata TaxID=455078 RepID=A0ABT8R862_9BACT|nr:amidase [Rhodocytophaga aerolata]MDO1448290.1 amidase [Rhodocytophaga aerolata]